MADIQADTEAAADQKIEQEEEVLNAVQVLSFAFLAGVDVYLKDLNAKQFNERRVKIVRQTCPEGKLAVNVPDTPIRILIKEANFTPCLREYDTTNRLRGLIDKWGTWEEGNEEKWVWNGPNEERYGRVYMESFVESYGNSSKYLVDVGDMFDKRLMDEKRALEIFNSARQLEPNDMRPMRRIAAIHIRNEEHEAAVLILEDMLRQDPNRVKTITELKGLYTTLKQLDGVERMFDRLAELDPTNIAMFKEFIEWMRANKRSNKKVDELWERILAHHPMDVLLLIEFAEWKETRKNFEKARDLYIRALDMPMSDHHERAKNQLRTLCETHYPDDDLPVQLQEPEEPEQPEQAEENAEDGQANENADANAQDADANENAQDANANADANAEEQAQQVEEIENIAELQIGMEEIAQQLEVGQDELEVAGGMFGADSDLELSESDEWS